MSELKPNSKAARKVADRIEGLSWDSWTGPRAIAVDRGETAGGKGKSYPPDLAGWIILEMRSGGAARICRDRGTDHDVAGTILGLSEEDTRKLLDPDEPEARANAKPGERGFISPRHAARVLRRWADTGRIEWWPGGRPPTSAARGRARHAAAAIEMRKWHDAGAEPGTLKTRKLPEGIEEGFSMQSTQYGCGAPADIMGTVLAIASRMERAWAEQQTRKGTPGVHPEVAIAGALLGVNMGKRSLGTRLLFPQGDWAGSWQCGAIPGKTGWISPGHAAEVLRRWARTGSVDWDAAWVPPDGALRGPF